ncbi:MAG: hypothetical protein HOC09_35285 [Deltaproteobacteria bacterium]|jgi:hypothetical protein|nr:hypothetical protein [Deltaproteobacteria bacterium]
MKVITRKIQAAGAHRRWMRQYPDDKDNKGALLKKLGDNPDPNAVDGIIGNKSWTSVGTCSECGKIKQPKLIMVGEPADYESYTAYLCENCVEKACNLLKSHNLEEK